MATVGGSCRFEYRRAWLRLDGGTDGGIEYIEVAEFKKAGNKKSGCRVEEIAR